jgi:hypothetical protein
MRQKTKIRENTKRDDGERDKDLTKRDEFFLYVKI